MLFAQGIGMGVNATDQRALSKVSKKIPDSITLNDATPLLRRVGYTCPSPRDALEAFRMHFWTFWSEGQTLSNKNVKQVYESVYQEAITKDEYAILSFLAEKYGHPVVKED